MAKKRSKKASDDDIVDKIVEELAGDPEALGNFIQDPWGFLEGQGVPPSLWPRIWRTVSLDVMEYLLSVDMHPVHDHV